MIALLLIYFIFISLVSLRQVLRGMHFLNLLGGKNLNGQFSSFPVENQNYPFIVVCIPVLRERNDNIIESIDHFLKIDYPHHQTSIVYITTEKEFAFPSDPLSNSVQFIKSKVLELKVSGEHRFMHIHYPYAKGDKADQLNYAIKELSKAFEDREFLIAVYDIDSRPDLHIFKIVASHFLESNRQVSSFQQYSLYFKNFSNLTIFMKCSAVHQTLWTFIYEIPTAFRQFALSEQIAANKKPLDCAKRRLVYCIGHGHFINKETLESVRYFPTNLLTEDLLLGYQLSLLGIPTKPILNFDVVDGANNIKSLVTQSGRWFGGETNIRYIYRQTINRGWKINICIKWAYLIRLYEIACWLFGPLIYVISLILSTKYPPIFVIGILSGLFYSIIKYVMFLSYTPKLNKLTSGNFNPSSSDKILIVLLSPLRCLTNCFGPLYFVAQSFILWVRGKKYEFERTEK